MSKESYQKCREERKIPKKENDSIIVQRLSAQVEGKVQNYSRVGVLSMMPMHGKWWQPWATIEDHYRQIYPEVL